MSFSHPNARRYGKCRRVQKNANPPIITRLDRRALFCSVQATNLAQVLSFLSLQYPSRQVVDESNVKSRIGPTQGQGPAISGELRWSYICPSKGAGFWHTRMDSDLLEVFGFHGFECQGDPVDVRYEATKGQIPEFHGLGKFKGIPYLNERR